MQDIKGVLIDLDGVVHQRGAAIPGSIEAISRLRQLNLDFRFITNTTRLPLRMVAGELEKAVGCGRPLACVYTRGSGKGLYRRSSSRPILFDQYRVEGRFRQPQIRKQARGCSC